MALASLSVDLDSLPHYFRIHGLGKPGGNPPDPETPDPVYAKAADRFGELCARLGLRGTAFCIGEELSRPEALAAAARLAAAGHELGNHGHAHHYALARQDPAAIAADVRLGGEAVQRASGRRPVGFRAPGYTLSAPLLSVLAAQGYRYDSSAFPAAPYWLAKAAVMAALALRGRPSGAVLDRPRALFAPRTPYRPHRDEPYGRGDLPLVELPVTTGLLGFPLIGTFVGALPPWLLRVLAVGTGRLPLFNLELHGIDLLDASEVPPVLASRQRELRVPAAERVRRIESLARRLDREWITLAGAAERLRPD
jgi:peptidoglycan-N-acetylglucosamine deacetylase